MTEIQRQVNVIIHDMTAKLMMEYVKSFEIVRR